MTENGKRMLDLVRETRKFHIELKKVLEAADSLMKEKGWAEKYQAYCHSDYSQSIYRPERWMPRLVWRSYYWPTDPNRTLAGIAIQLDDLENEKQVTEPIITGCAFRAFEDKDWKYWEHDLFLTYINAKGPLDGIARELTIPEKSSFAKVVMASYGNAFPLAEIDGIDGLNSKLIDPLHTKSVGSRLVTINADDK